MRQFVADLHIHTVLSPCAEYQMVPELIVQSALEKGIDLLAITDHNSGENAGAVMQAARNQGVCVLPGMEVETREGVHVLALFDHLDALESWQREVYYALPAEQNNERAFGVQLVVDALGNLITVNRRLLITSIGMTLEEVDRGVKSRGGLCIPAHVDRPANGLIGVLGFIPDGFAPVAVEVSKLVHPVEAARRFPLAHVAILRSSDAHVLEDVGRVSTTFVIEDPSVCEIALACRGEAGRRLLVA